jgi:glycosyltransferase involved in cell wall biosynthesis
MKVLFCSRNPLDPRLGAPKALIELAGQLDRLGWQSRLASDVDICPDIRKMRGGIRAAREFSRSLALFLHRNAKDFDIVDYEHTLLPVPRSGFSPATLFVARVPLLVHYLEKLHVPRATGIRPILGLIVKGPYRRLEARLRLASANRTLQGADLINVSNQHDRAELGARGFDPRKIAVLPLGLTQARMAQFHADQPAAPSGPRVAFVGTFDVRKGAHDFPEILGAIAEAVPECKFRLLGSIVSEERLLRRFPPKLRPSLEIHPVFDPDDLPRLLRDCSVGMFPSYFEGFGFGVLEMLAASLPVIAYDAPGPPMMLSSEYLVPRGAKREMASKIISLLRSPDRLAAARLWARARAQEFTWERAAQLTSAVYSEHVAMLRSRPGQRTLAEESPTAST